MGAGPAYIFVYNADSGLFNTLSDMAHKMFSPESYACNLCMITHSHFGMREEWKSFIQELGVAVEFLHRDEFRGRYHTTDIGLPAVFRRQGDDIEECISAREINACKTMEDLQGLIRARLRYRSGG